MYIFAPPNVSHELFLTAGHCAAHGPSRDIPLAAAGLGQLQPIQLDTLEDMGRTPQQQEQGKELIDPLLYTTPISRLPTVEILKAERLAREIEASARKSTRVYGSQYVWTVALAANCM